MDMSLTDVISSQFHPKAWTSRGCEHIPVTELV